MVTHLAHFWQVSNCSRAPNNLLKTVVDYKTLVTVSDVQEEIQGVTPHLAHVNDLNIGAFNDAEHRGPRFYDYLSESDSGSNIDSDSEEEDSSSSSVTSEVEDKSTSASSFETNERKLITRTYRVCKPCPHEMIKKYSNIGIKWICGGYQRARRSFKSACMMRYRNCEDGTMFVKLYDHRCKNDTYHGKTWFYIYRA